MPLNDDYKSEKLLHELSTNMAEAITDALQAVEPQRYEFALFLFDTKEGLMQHITTVDMGDLLKAISMWHRRETVDLERVEIIIDPSNETKQ